MRAEFVRVRDIAVAVSRDTAVRDTVGVLVELLGVVRVITFDVVRADTFVVSDEGVDVTFSLDTTTLLRPDIVALRSRWLSFVPDDDRLVERDIPDIEFVFGSSFVSYCWRETVVAALRRVAARAASTASSAFAQVKAAKANNDKHPAKSSFFPFILNICISVADF